MQVFEPAPFTIVDPSLARLYAYWTLKRGTHAMPLRNDIDPVELGFILGNISLVDVLRDPLRFWVRLHGTELAHRDGEDWARKMLHEIPQAEFGAVLQEHFVTVVETGLPYRSASNTMLDGKVMRYEAIILPLADDRQNVQRLIIGARHHS